MKKLLFTLLIGSAALTAFGQDSQYGAVDSFYQANTDLDTGSYARRIVNPAYWLVDFDRWHEMNERLTSGGFVRLGVSNWEGNGGVPEKEVALAYAHAIGADVIIYATETSTNYRTDNYGGYRTDHTIGFYAKQSVSRAAPVVRNRVTPNYPSPRQYPSDAAVSRAVDRWTDAHHGLRVQGGVHYDASTDTYRWIGPQYGKPMSKPAPQLLNELNGYFDF